MTLSRLLTSQRQSWWLRHSEHWRNAYRENRRWFLHGDGPSVVSPIKWTMQNLSWTKIRTIKLLPNYKVLKGNFVSFFFIYFVPSHILSLEWEFYCKIRQFQNGPPQILSLYINSSIPSTSIMHISPEYYKFTLYPIGYMLSLKTKHFTHLPNIFDDEIKIKKKKKKNEQTIEWKLYFCVVCLCVRGELCLLVY